MTIVAYKGELEFCGANERDNGGRTVRFRLIRDPGEHPFAKFTRKAWQACWHDLCRRHHGGVKDASTAYSDEVMLAGWADGLPAPPSRSGCRPRSRATRSLMLAGISPEPGRALHGGFRRAGR